MTSIAGVAVYRMRGERPRNQVAQYFVQARPNLDGHELIDLGKRGKPVMLTIEVDHNSPSTLEDTFNAKHGELITVVTPEGQTINNLRVMEVHLTASTRHAATVGGINAGAWMLTFAWLLLPEGT